MPSLTVQMALDTFKYLVFLELKKRHPKFLDYCDGCQEGAIMILSLLFGQVEEEEWLSVVKKGNSWIHIIQEIVNNDLSSWSSHFENLKDFASIDLDKLNKDIETAVVNYSVSHPRKMVEALQKI